MGGLISIVTAAFIASCVCDGGRATSSAGVPCAVVPSVSHIVQQFDLVRLFIYFFFHGQRLHHFVTNREICYINLIASYSLHYKILLSRFVPQQPDTMTEHRDKLLDAIKNLLSSGTHFDFTITCGPDIYHVHRAIICARSPNFSRVVAFKGAETNKSNIDLTPEEDGRQLIKLMV